MHVAMPGSVCDSTRERSQQADANGGGWLPLMLQVRKPVDVKSASNRCPRRPVGFACRVGDQGIMSTIELTREHPVIEGSLEPTSDRPPAGLARRKTRRIIRQVQPNRWIRLSSGFRSLGCSFSDEVTFSDSRSDGCEISEYIRQHPTRTGGSGRIPSSLRSPSSHPPTRCSTLGTVRASHAQCSPSSAQTPASRDASGARQSTSGYAS